MNRLSSRAEGQSGVLEHSACVGEAARPKSIELAARPFPPAERWGLNKKTMVHVCSSGLKCTNVDDCVVHSGMFQVPSPSPWSSPIV